MSNNRHVPLITGVISIGLAAWVVFAFAGWWRYVPGTLLLMFGWASIKTALFASKKEVNELTGSGAMSQETRKKLDDRF